MVFINGQWHEISQVHNASQDLDYSDIHWIRRKQQEELQMAEMRQRYPALDDAMRDFETVKALVMGYENS